MAAGLWLTIMSGSPYYFYWRSLWSHNDKNRLIKKYCSTHFASPLSKEKFYIAQWSGGSAAASGTEDPGSNAARLEVYVHIWENICAALAFVKLA
jgi:hypothetical protein